MWTCHWIMDWRDKICNANFDGLIITNMCITNHRGDCYVRHVFSDKQNPPQMPIIHSHDPTTYLFTISKLLWFSLIEWRPLFSHKVWMTIRCFLFPKMIEKHLNVAQLLFYLCLDEVKKQSVTNFTKIFQNGNFRCSQWWKCCKRYDVLI